MVINPEISSIQTLSISQQFATHAQQRGVELIFDVALTGVIRSGEEERKSFYLAIQQKPRGI